MVYSVAKHPTIDGAYGVRSEEGAWIENDVERGKDPNKTRQALAFLEEGAKKVADIHNENSNQTAAPAWAGRKS